jgi:hypothetical protein
LGELTLKILEKHMSKEQAAPQIPMFYFMCHGTCYFSQPKSGLPTQIDQTSLNAVIISPKSNIDTGALSSVQQQFHGLLMQRAEEGQELIVLDILINNIMPLGLMTADEFMRQGAFTPVAPVLPPELAAAMAGVLPE